jgi:GAF domain-containing protein
MACFSDLLGAGLGVKSVILAVQSTGKAIRRNGAGPADVEARSTNPEMARIVARLGYTAHLVVPIAAPVSQRVLGSITLANGPRRSGFTDADERTAVDIGRRAGLAVDNSSSTPTAWSRTHVS